MSGNKGSKFGFLKGALQVAEAGPVEEPSLDTATPSVEEPRPSPAPSVVAVTETVSKPKGKPRVQPAEPARPVGRPPGKRSDGDHIQVTAYIRADTRRRVRKILNDNEGGPDFSELVEELLSKWLKSRT